MKNSNITNIIFLLIICFNLINSASYVKVIQSAKNTNDLLTEKPPLTLFPTKMTSDFDIKINKGKEFQTILGFGGAFTEAASYIYSQLNSTLKEEFLEAYFGLNGNQYTVCRTHINSCDFSLGSYSFDDVDQDFNLTHFSIEHNEGNSLLPLMREALKKTQRPLKIFGSPWSPPAWMKSNKQMDGSFSPGLVQDPRYFASWALFYSKFINSYKEAGVDIWGITIQNEPGFAAPWEACIYSPVNQRDFLRDYLGPLMRKEHPNVKIMIYDYNKDDVVEWVNTIMTDNETSQYADGTAFHIYSGSSFENLETSHILAPDKFLLATEACACPGVSLMDWGRGELYGYDIIGDLNNWAVGWVDWNILLDMQGGPNHLNNYCDAPIIADTVNQVLHYQVPYYYMGQISKFVLPGSKRIESKVYKVTSSSPVELSDLSIVSFRNTEKRVVVVIMNTSLNQTTITIELEKKYVQTKVLPNSIQTLIF